MRKNGDSHARYETVVLFLKALLLSFWIGIDLIAAIIVPTLGDSTVHQYRILLVCVITLLASGTAWAVLFVCTAAASVRERMRIDEGHGIPRLRIDKVLVQLHVRTIKRFFHWSVPKVAALAVILVVLVVVVNGMKDAKVDPVAAITPVEKGSGKIKEAVKEVAREQVRETKNEAPTADPVLAQKCQEVAELEQKLYQADKTAVIAQCLDKYKKEQVAAQSISTVVRQ